MMMLVVNAFASSVLHEPSAAIMLIAALLPEPGLPPVAVMYTCVAPVQEYAPVIVNWPCAPELGGVAISGADMEATPPVPTA